MTLHTLHAQQHRKYKVKVSTKHLLYMSLREAHPQGTMTIISLAGCKTLLCRLYLRLEDSEPPCQPGLAVSGLWSPLWRATSLTGSTASKSGPKHGCSGVLGEGEGLGVCFSGASVESPLSGVLLSCEDVSSKQVVDPLGLPPDTYLYMPLSISVEAGW